MNDVPISNIPDDQIVMSEDEAYSNRRSHKKMLPYQPLKEAAKYRDQVTPIWNYIYIIDAFDDRAGHSFPQI